MGIAVVFPGQGTQATGMGRPWREHPAWHVIDDAEAAFGEPLAHLVLDASPDELARTREAQLAVLLTSLVVWEAIRDSLPTPVAFAGHSLGQVTALIAAGVLPLDVGVRFAARRAELTQAAADAHPGKMAALLGATPDQADAACAGFECWIANDNAPGQVVIAGTPEGLEGACAQARDLGIKRALPLNVGGAFHTPLMAEATAGLVTELATVGFSAPVAPVVSNHDGRAYSDGAGWRERLAAHVSVPVRWRTTMTTIADLGATTCLEVGHGSMLAGLAKRATPDLPVVGISTPGSLDSLTTAAASADRS